LEGRLDSSMRPSFFPSLVVHSTCVVRPDLGEHAEVRLADGRAQRWQTSNNIAEHATLLRRQVELGLNDPATRVLAGAIVSGNFDSAHDPRTGQSVPVVPYHGRWYRGAKDWASARQLCAARDYGCEVTAIWNFVVLNIRYTQDQADEDTYSTLRASLEAGAEDCDGMTIAFATLLKAVGFESVLARIISLHGDSWDHVYPVVNVPRAGWMALDATEKGWLPGKEFKGYAEKRDFAL